MGFIDAFEKLVLSAICSLEMFPNVKYLRIRFVDIGMSSPTAQLITMFLPANILLRIRFPSIEPVLHSQRPTVYRRLE
jgi:hypothetical protein